MTNNEKDYINTWGRIPYDEYGNYYRYAEPACKKAEILFLLYFLYFSQNQIKISPADVVIQKYHNKNEALLARAVRKQLIELNYGEPTYLIVDGPLVGTIAKKSADLEKQNCVTILRAIIPNDKVILSELLLEKQNFESQYEEAELGIRSFGYLDFLIYLMTKSGLDINKKEFSDNILIKNKTYK